MNALRQAVSELEINLDALLVTRPVDIEYLSGFCGHDSWAVIGFDSAAIISDGRYDEQLNPIREAGEFEVVIGTRHRLHAALLEVAERLGIRRLAVQADHLTVAMRSRIARECPGVEIADTEGLVGGLRMCKDAIEIAAIERAVLANEAALRATLPQIRLGMTEREVSALLEYEMKRGGGSGSGFTPIIAVGSHSSLPHYETADAPLAGDAALLIDWGTTVGGYQSDLTRTFGINTLPLKVREIYPIVLEAQLAAIDAIRPGRPCADIDAVAREVIDRAGYGEFFVHGLGHGMGKEVHEPPYFNALETATLLKPGMVMTVEPGIYLPGIGGVRIEDDIVVTESGCRVLSSFPKDLESAVLQV